MATVWEIAARSVCNLFSLYFVYFVIFIISRFGFKSGICLLIAPVPVHCFSITFNWQKFSGVFHSKVLFWVKDAKIEILKPKRVLSVVIID